MKVILLKDMEKLGKMGDVITVKDGYARNMLIPKNMAREATASGMKILEVLKKKRAMEEEKALKELSALADKIQALSVTIAAKVGDEEKLFGSVTNEMIADLLAAEGLTIDKRDILLEEPIKKLGVYQVTVKLHHDVRASLKVWVVKE